MISLARKRANKSTCRERHGAVITKAGSVVASGYNSYKTSPTWGVGPLCTMHAEVSAIRDAVRHGINLRGSTIYVARQNATNANQMSRPCHGCREKIQQYGIAKVIYTDAQGKPVQEYP